MIDFKIYESDVSIALSTIKSHENLIKDFKTKSVKDYLFYMNDGSVSFNTSDYYFSKDVKNGLFNQDGIVKEEEIEFQSNSILKNRGKFKLYGVIEFDGINGYKLFQDFLDSKKFMDYFKVLISESFSLDSSALYYFAALHKNTKNRHIHFLMYSSKDKKVKAFDDEECSFENKIIKSVCHFLNSEEYRKFLDKRYSTNNLSGDEIKDSLRNKLRCENLNHCFEIIEYFKENRDEKFDEYENLDEVINLEIDEISENLICMDKKLEEKFKILKENRLYSFLIKNAFDENASSFNAIIYDARHMVFDFLKENIKKERLLFDADLLEDTKKEIGKENLKDLKNDYLVLEKKVYDKYLKKFEKVKIPQYFL